MKTVEEVKEIIKQEYPEAVKVEKITDKEGNKWEVGWKQTDQEADSEQNNL